MAKLTLSDLASLTNEQAAIAAINANSALIETALENTLSRDGTTPNSMAASLDLNSNRILNLPAPATDNEPLRLSDLNDFVGGGTVTNIPTGGSTGDVLTKTSSANYAVSWVSDTAVLSAGTNIAVTGTSPATVSTTTNPTFSGITTISSATASTTTANGALVVAGGLGLGGAANVGGALTVTGVTTLSSTTASTTPTTGGTLVGGGLGVVGAINGGTFLGLGVSGSAAGSIKFFNGTSGVTTLQPGVGALGSTALTLPIATDTLVGKATTDIFTNKTFDTAGVGNAFSIASVAVTANTGTGAIARATSPTFVTPTLGAALATTINGINITANTGTLTLNTNTLSVAGSGVNVILGTSSSGSTVTFQGTDTYIGRATTDTLTNKTYDTAGTGNVFKINGTTVSAITGSGSTAVLSTAPTIVTSATVPLVIGGTGTGSSLSLQSTSGSGATDFVKVLVGNNGAVESTRFNTSGGVSIGATTDVGVGNLLVNNYIRSGGYVRCTTDLTKTSDTALANVTGLSIALAANTDYYVEATLFTTATASAGGVKASFNYTGTLTSAASGGYVLDTTALFAENWTSGSLASIGATTTGANGNPIMKLYLWINTLNAGTLTVQFAQNASSGSASSARTGSFMKAVLLNN